MKKILNFGRIIAKQSGENAFQSHFYMKESSDHIGLESTSQKP